MYGCEIVLFCCTFRVLVAATLDNTSFRDVGALDGRLNVTIGSLDGLNLAITRPPRHPTVGVGLSGAENTGLSSRERKMNDVGNIVQYLLVPAFALSGIMPWVMPGIMIVVAVVGLINQIAFGSSLFMLIRTYIFDVTPEEHVIYLNTGYDKKHEH